MQMLLSVKDFYRRIIAKNIKNIKDKRGLWDGVLFVFLHNQHGG